MRRQMRSAFTLFQLLIVLAILAILLALLLPAIVRVRAAAARMQSQNNLKRLVLALYNYQPVYHAYPPGVDDNHFSAGTKLLPFIEFGNVPRMIDFKKPFDDKANVSVRQLQLKVFLSPRDPIPTVKPEWGATNYLFNEACFYLNSNTKITDIKDGTNDTIAVGETLKGDGKTQAIDARRQYVRLKTEDLKNTGPNTGVKFFKDDKNISGDRCASWMDGRFLQGAFNGKLRPNDERPDVSCGGVSGVSALRTYDDCVLVGLFGGSVRSVKATISHKTWKAAMSPNGNEVLGNDW